MKEEMLPAFARLMDRARNQINNLYPHGDDGLVSFAEMLEAAAVASATLIEAYNPSLRDQARRRLRRAHLRVREFFSVW